MKEPSTFFSSPTVRKLIKASPSPALAKNHFLLLLESCGEKTISSLGTADLKALVRLLGSSSYLSDILLQQGRHCCEIFSYQINIERKPVSEHLADLEPAVSQSESLDQFCAALRRHKQREYLRIGARDLLPQVSLEETVRELSALADACLESAYRFCRANVEQDYGTLGLPGTQQPGHY